ncbi:MAG: GNAT family N-acetyltransferase [Acetobacteraceae bacterium]|nr:GNAT family N-acetyltransferase [Acetobacteraceae bacterium]
MPSIPRFLPGRIDRRHHFAQEFIVWSMASIHALHLRHTPTPDDLPRVTRLWAQLGWGQDDEDGRRRVSLAFAGSAWIALADWEGEFAGYARALSDGVLVTYLVEVAVAPSCRRKGVGGALIQSCLDAFQHTAVYADAAPEIIGLNTRYGLLPRPSHLTACARGPRTVAAT